MKLIFHRSQTISNPYVVVLLTDVPGFHKEVGNFQHSCCDEVITSLMSLITWCDCLMCLLTWCDCVISGRSIDLPYVQIKSWRGLLEGFGTMHWGNSKVIWDVYEWMYWQYNGPHTRMLAVLLAGDDPRTSWFFQLVCEVGLLHWERPASRTFAIDACIFPNRICKRVVVIATGRIMRLGV